MIYYEKHADEYKAYTGFIGKTKSRSAYIALPDKEKMQYIKRSETKFDALKVNLLFNYCSQINDRFSFDFMKWFKLREINGKPQLLSSILSINEMILLFEAYGMPEAVPAR